MRYTVTGRRAGRTPARSPPSSRPRSPRGTRPAAEVRQHRSRAAAARCRRARSHAPTPGRCAARSRSPGQGSAGTAHLPHRGLRFRPGRGGIGFRGHPASWNCGTDGVDMLRGDGAALEPAFLSNASTISAGIRPRSAIGYPFWRAHARIALLCWRRSAVIAAAAAARARRGRPTSLEAWRAAVM